MTEPIIGPAARRRAGPAMAATLALCILLAACQPRPKPPMVEIPDNFSRSGMEAVPDRWWEEFGDSELNLLIERALDDNLDILTAWDRLDQSLALAQIEGAALYPNVTGSLGKNNTQAMGHNASLLNNSPAANFGSFYNWSLSLSYEVDLWGRVRNAREAAEMDYRASEQDLRTVALTISGQVASVWYQLVQAELELELMEKQVETNETYVELLELRFGQGLASAADVLQQRQQLSSTRGDMSTVRMRRDVLAHSLNALLGRHPTAPLGAEPEALPELPPLPETGIPAELIRRRPDVVAAHYRVEAADHDVASAIAARFPAISLSAAASGEDHNFEQLFDSWILNLAANMTAPIFDAGRRKKTVELNEASASMALHNYSNTVLSAVLEVEDALVQEQRQAEYVKSLEDQVALAEETILRTRELYLNGATDYLPVLTSISTHQRLERGLLAARAQLVSYRVDLYRALGGGFEIQRNPEHYPDEHESIEHPGIRRDNRPEG